MNDENTNCFIHWLFICLEKDSTVYFVLLRATRWHGLDFAYWMSNAGIVFRLGLCGAQECVVLSVFLLLHNRHLRRGDDWHRDWFHDFFPAGCGVDEDRGPVDDSEAAVEHFRCQMLDGTLGCAGALHCRSLRWDWTGIDDYEGLFRHRHRRHDHRGVQCDGHIRRDVGRTDQGHSLSHSIFSVDQLYGAENSRLERNEKICRKLVSPYKKSINQSINRFIFP